MITVDYVNKPEKCEACWFVDKKRYNDCLWCTILKKAVKNVPEDCPIEEKN